MFNRNNYTSLKNLPMFMESYTSSTYLVNGQNTTLSSIIRDLDEKQQSSILLDNQIASFKSTTGSDSVVIQGLESAKMGIQKSIGSYQKTLATEVSKNDLIELHASLSEKPDPSMSTQRQINFLKFIIDNKS